MSLYFIANGPAPTAAAQVAVTTGTAIKTMLQLKLGANYTQNAKIVEWGISTDGVAASVIKVELLCTSTVGGTVTEYVAADFINLDPLGAAVTDDNPFAFTAAGDESGYTATAEGTIAATRVFDVQILTPPAAAAGAAYVKQFPLGREPMFKAAEYCRIRVTATVACNAYCYLVIEV